MYSRTFRDLLSSYYDVQVGMYSYGPALWPGGLPRGTRVGNFCSLASGLGVFRRNHPPQRLALHPFFFNRYLGVIPKDSISGVEENPLRIDHDAWIGANTTITPRCKSIGIGAIVGAGSVVTDEVPPFAIVAGNPAKLIRFRFPAQIQEAILESRWWEHSMTDLVPHLSIFLSDVSLENAQALRDRLRKA